MKCPACSQQLFRTNVGAITLDYCKEGCGGIWFDANELEQFDGENNNIDSKLLRGKGAVNVVIDRSKQRFCPKCNAAPLDRHVYDSREGFEVDSCSCCGGIWLDTGELSFLRSENKQQEIRQRTATAFAAQYQNAVDAGQIPKRAAAVFKLLFR